MTNRFVTQAVLAMILLLTANGPASAATEIVYGTYSEPRATLNKDGLTPWMEDVKKRSNGSLTFNFVPGGALVGTKTTLPSIRDGLVDGGMVVALYYVSDLPVNNVVTSLSGVGGDARVDAAAAIETTLFDCAGCLEEWERWNLKYISGYSSSGYSLLCAKPAKTLDDVRGRKVRAPGSLGRMAVALGMTPLNITVTETYEGLQRGQLDCTFGPPGWLQTFGLVDVAKHVILTERGSAFGGSMLNINTDKWKSLTKDQRRALVNAAALGVTGMVYGYIDEDREALRTAQEKGVQVVQPDAPTKAALDKYAAAEPRVNVNAATERGMKNAQAITDAFLKNHARWREIVSKIGDDRHAYQAALQREIFDRYPLD